MGSSCSTDQRDEEEWCRPRISRSIKRQNKKKKKSKMDHERRKHLLEALNAEAQTTELLSRIPGRICNNGSTSSACAFTQQGKKGTNQDAMVVWEHYASRKDTLLCGIFDGHGPYGHLVARRVRDTLPSKLMGMWKARMRGEIEIEDEDDDEEEDEKEEEEAEAEEEEEQYVRYDNGIHSSTQQHEDVNTHHSSWDPNEQQSPGLNMQMWRECIVKAFRQMDRDLRLQPTIDCFCSGTTAVILLQQGKELIMGNVGDSRAVLATFCRPDAAASRVKPDVIQALQLTLDLKPSLPREAARIRRFKGRVFAMQDEPEVARVWLPYDNAPGLAMARAFGDFCLKEYGLIAVPDITYRTLNPEDQFVILATDGIWDVMSNQQAVEVVSSAPSRVTAARLLVETAVRAWRLKYPTSKVDDCAVICLFFHREATTTVRRNQTTTTSSYYYICKEEDDEGQEDDDNEDMEITASMSKLVRAPAPTPTTPSPSAHTAHSNGELQLAKSNTDGVVVQANESEEISWSRSKTLRSTTDPAQNKHAEQKSPVLNGHDGYITTEREVEIEEASSSNSSMLAQGKASSARRSLAEYMNINEEEEEWSALEGVVRVNSILNLPRFKVGDSPSFRNPYDFASFEPH